MNFLRKESSDIKEIWTRIKKRDFSGNTGLAIKNSVFQFSTNAVAKIGSLVFTIILARILMPELFGLYNLALSTILIFAAFSDLGVGPTLIRFVSRELGRNNKKRAKAYTSYLGKIKIILIAISILILIFSAKFISNNFYQKPIFLALLAGVLYIIFIQIFGFLQSLLQASNYFRGVFHKEIIFQSLRLILIPLAVVMTLKYSLSNEQVLFYIILALSFSYLLTALFVFLLYNKKTDFIKEQGKRLTSRQTREINKFLLPTAALVFSGIFFSYIDKIMLGHFVSAEFIGYYSAALSLIGALIPLMSFSAVVLFPIFSRLKNKKRLEEGFKKSIRITLLISVGAFLVVLLLANVAILIIYGKEYFLSVNILRLLSLLLLIVPVIALYQTYLLSQDKPRTVAKLLVFTTLINIILNYILITSLLKYGGLAAVYGAGIATLISQGFYLGGLVLGRKKR